MPIISSEYNPPFWFRQADISTIFSGRVRKVRGVAQQRERLELPDGDFLDLDWSFSKEKTKRCVILLHGLEGNAQRPYILGCADIFTKNGYDVCAANHRGCSGEPNRLYRSYHSGNIADLQQVINYVENAGYTEVFIKGFSLGGNIALYYAGNEQVSRSVKAVFAVSVPCDLSGSSKRLVSSRNLLYATIFLKTLKRKILEKSKCFPEEISVEEIKNIKNLRNFDDLYSSKAHNFTDAEDYYKQCSSLFVLKNITIPTFLLNAQNDSFLSDKSFPYEIAKNSDYFYLETPKFGGHVAFYDKNNVFYNEKKALEFFNKF